MLHLLHAHLVTILCTQDRFRVRVQGLVFRVLVKQLHAPLVYTR